MGNLSRLGQTTLEKMWLLYATYGVVFTIPILALAYRVSRPVRFYMKYYLFNVIYLVNAFCTVCTVGIFDPRSPENFHRAAKRMFRVTRLFFDIEVEVLKGIEHLPKREDEKCIIVANHQSSVDMLVLLKLAPPRTTFLAKKELLYTPLFGLACWICGVVFINRGNSASARKVMDGAVKLIKEQKVNLWIFPEGTRSQTGSMLPFKKGAFHMAQQTQMPILPIVVSDYSPLFNKKTKTFENGTIRVTILPKVSTKGLTPDDVGALTEQVQEQMVKVFKEDQLVGRNNDNIQGKKAD